MLVLNRYTIQKFYCVFAPHFKRKYFEDNTRNQHDVIETDEAKESNANSFKVFDKKDVYKSGKTYLDA